MLSLSPFEGCDIPASKMGFLWHTGQFFISCHGITSGLCTGRFQWDWELNPCLSCDYSLSEVVVDV